jgi:hypothetical protein
MPDTSPRNRDHAVRTEASNAVYRLAIAAGAQPITRPLYAGADTTTRDVDPAAGLRAARDLEYAALRLARDYIRQAREAGLTWHQIGTTMNLPPGSDLGPTPAEAAFDYAAGDPGTHHARTYGRSVTWTGTTCGKAISDHGHDNGPADDERGHAPGCQRHARTIQAWQAEWDALEAGWEAGQ